MNERIKQLAKQLGPIATIGNWGRVEWADNIYPQLGDRMYASIDLEKFAELIVQECVGWVNDNVGLIDEEARADLLKHFGVEE